MLKSFFAGFAALMAATFGVHHAPPTVAITPPAPVAIEAQPQQSQLTVINDYFADPTRLSAGTRFEDEDGNIFRAEGAFSVPGKRGTADGRIVINILPDKAGQHPSGRLSVPGLSGSPKLYEHIFAEPIANAQVAAVSTTQSFQDLSSAPSIRTEQTSSLPSNDANQQEQNSASKDAPYSSFASKADITTLASLISSLTQALSTLASRPASLAPFNDLAIQQQIAALQRQIAQTNVINQLPANITVQGLSGLTAGDIPALDYLSLSGGTISGDLSVSGALSAGSLNLTGGTTISSTGTTTFAGGLTATSLSYLATTTITGGLTVNGNTNITQGGELTVGDKIIAPGEIGLGTSSPYAKLAVQGTDAAQTTFSIWGASGQTAPLVDIFSNGGTNFFRLSAGGDLTVSGNTNLATTTITGGLTVNGNTNITQGGQLTVGDKIIAPGEIGLGTSTPGAKLAVQSTSASQTAFLLYGTTTQSAPLMDAFNSSGTNFFRLSAAGDTTLGGNLLVAGNSTTTSLFVKSTASIPSATIGALTATSSVAVSGPASFFAITAFGGTATSTFGTNGSLTIGSTISGPSASFFGSLAIGGTATTTFDSAGNATTTSLFVKSQLSSPNATFGALTATTSLAVSSTATSTFAGGLAAASSFLVFQNGATQFGGNLTFASDGSYNIGANGVGRPGIIRASLDVKAGRSVQIGANDGQSATLQENGANKLILYNSVASAAPLLQLGGTTSAFPAFKQVGAGLSVRLADDSADATLTAGTLSLSGTSGTSTIASGQGFTIGGSQFVLQQGSGFVGIGTANPASILDISKGSNTFSGIHMINNSSGSSAFTGIYFNNDSANGAGLILNSTNRSADIGTGGALLYNDGGALGIRANGSIKFSAANSFATTQLYLDPTGSLGLGTTTPFGKFALSLNKGETYPGNNAFIIASSTASATSTLFVVQNNGNVGIGTAAPTSLLHLVKTGAAGATTNVVAIRNNTGADNTYSGISFTNDIYEFARISGGATSWNGDLGALIFSTRSDNTGAIERMRITGAGNVGIGTTNPGNPLEVHVGTDQNFTVSTGGSQTRLSAVNDAHSANVPLRFQASDYHFLSASALTEPLTISSSGNVGIGTTNPGSKLEVQGTAAFQLFNATSTSGTSTIASGQGFTIGGSQFVLQQGSGNVGIGTTRPAGNLHIFNSSGSKLILGGTADGSVNLDFDNSADDSSVRFRIGYIGGNKTRFSSPLTAVTFADWDGNNNLITLYQNATLQGTLLTLGQQATGATPGTGATIAINGVSGTPTNLAGGNLTLQSGQGTGSATPGDIIFNTADIGVSGNTAQSTSTKLVLKASGSLGLGTTTPFAKFALSLKSGETYPGNNAFIIASSTASATSTLFVVQNTGNVGIGTSNPTGKFTISGNAAVIGTASQSNISAFTGNGLRIEASGVANASQDAITYQASNGGGGAAIAFGRGGSYDTFMSFYTNPGGGTGLITEAMRINSSGNVGIGTTNPLARLTLQKGAAPTSPTVDNSYLHLGGTDFTANGYALISYGYAGNSGEYSPAYSGFLLTTASGSGKGALVFGTRDDTNSTHQPTERMRIDSAGNIGIGTTTPNALLTIKGTTLSPSLLIGNVPLSGVPAAAIAAVNSSNQALALYGASGQSADVFDVYDSSAAQRFGVSVTGGQMNGGWSIGGGGSLTISTAGAGNDLFRLNNVGGSGHQYNLGSQNNGTFVLRDATLSADRLTVDATGNVGIGTTSPVAKLVVADSASPAIKVADSDFGNGATDGLDLQMSGTEGYLWNYENGGMHLATNNQERLTISNSGNVGIGTTTQSSLLTLGGSGSIGLLATYGDQGNNTYYSAFGAGAGSVGRAYFGYDPTFGATVQGTSAHGIAFNVNQNSFGSGQAMVINSSGNVGIGTTTPNLQGLSSAYKVLTISNNSQDGGSILEMSGSPSGANSTVGAITAWQGATKVGAFGINRGSALNTSLFNVQTKNSTDSTPQERFRIDENGNVGIGTTSPAAKLQVDGDVLPNKDNAYYMGTTTYRWAAVYAANGTIQTSDARLKSNVADLNYGLADLLKLRPVSFSWTAQPQQGTHLGFIAQEVQPIMPETVNVGDDANHTLGLTYTEFIPVMVKSIQSIANITGLFQSNLISWLASSANGIGSLFAREGHFSDRLCVGSASGPNGEGETCINQQQLAALLSAATSTNRPESVTSSPPGDGAGAVQNPSPDSASSSPASDASAGTPPVIEIRGDNPATVHVGDTYSDLGATITGPQEDLNLGIHTFVGNTPLEWAAIDTSAPATYHINYVATDRNGLTATTTRTVNIVAANAAPAATSSDAAAATSNTP